MTTTLILELVALALLLFCSAFFSSAETALFSLNPIQVHHIRRRDPRAAEASGRPYMALQRRGPNGLQRAPGSLPVLEAFQDFLETERQKARRRLFSLVAVFTVILLAIVATGILFGFYSQGRISSALASMRRDVTVMKHHAKNQTDGTLRSLVAVQSNNDRLARDIARERDAIKDIRARIDDQGQVSLEDIVGVRTSLAQLQQENDALRRSLDSVFADWSSVTGMLTRASIAPYNEPVGPRRDLLPTYPSLPHTTIAMTIVRAGEVDPVAWRLPIPE